jgi:hypothetical protein
VPAPPEEGNGVGTVASPGAVSPPAVPACLRFIGIAGGIRAGGREHLPVFVVLALYWFARVAWTGGHPSFDLRLSAFFARSYAILTILAAFLIAANYAFAVTRRAPGSYLAFRAETWRGFGREYLTAQRLTSVLLAWAALTLLTPLFLHWKADIGAVVPFVWDERFLRWDRALHFGRHPWEWLQSWLGRPPLTRIIDLLYGPGWILIAKPFVFLAVAWSSNRALASRFLLSYAVLWVLLGTVLAYAFASAGPAYYTRVVPGGEAPYDGLLAYLAAVDASGGLTATGTAASLWADYATQAWPRVGISAMPSMHVAVATLIVLVGFGIHRVVGIPALVYLGVTVVGSVHLAWHYAIDAYASIPLTVGVWWAAGGFLRSWSGSDTPGARSHAEHKAQ